MSQIWGHTPRDASAQCWKCKHRLRKITEGCHIITLTTAVAYNVNSMYDDIYGCNEFVSLDSTNEKVK